MTVLLQHERRTVRDGVERRAKDAALLLLALSLLVGCGNPPPGPPEQVEWFTDATRESGLDFTHVNGMTGKLYISEIMGPGGALLDYDNDGDLDLYLVQGHALEPEPGRAGPPPLDRLFRNDLEIRADGSRTLRFTDVTEASGIRSAGYGMGVAVGDYDNDGWVDLYVTNFGENRLWHNDGDGTFQDVTRSSGTADDRWSVSAAFVDYDRDGWLDLYVGNYLDFNLANHKDCFYTRRDYCSPKSYEPVPDRLYRNNGDGTFEDVTARSRIGREYGGALGVIEVDFDRNGRPDIYVANDGLPNQCWMNQGDGTFVNEALLEGLAVNAEGDPEASMGVDAGDFDNDGDEDLFMSHWTGETNTLYVNVGGEMFEDRTSVIGLGAPSKAFTGFGTSWFDYDNDGWLDLLVVNGAVQLIEELVLAGDPFPVHQPNQLFRNIAGERFEDVTAAAGPVFELSETSRGAAFGDVDNDGDTDVLLVNNNGPARLLRNNLGNRNHWLGLRLIDGNGRDMFGAWVGVTPATGPALWRRVRAAASYASSNDPRPLFGLGERTGPVTVEILWPDGTAERREIERVDRWVTLVRGDERPAERSP